MQLEKRPYFSEFRPILAKKPAVSNKSLLFAGKILTQDAVNAIEAAICSIQITKDGAAS